MANALSLSWSCTWPQPTVAGQTSQTGGLLKRDRADENARRFQAWQLAALDAHPAGTDLLAVFVKRKAQLEIEYNEALFPQVGAWLEAAGLAFAERNPLMACRPDVFMPSAAPQVIVHRLTTVSDAADLNGFQTLRWTNGGDNEEKVPPAGQLKKQLASEASVYLLAWLDGERAGTGVSHSLKGAAELVGVVTRKDKRRRGVAVTVTSGMVARHFAASGDFVFLDAANEEAARVYGRLGFTWFGDNVVYRGRP